MILTVHDELVFEVPENEIDNTIPCIREEMESAMELRVPLVVDIGIGNNWSEAH
jgi:DNA polymerase-1